MLYFKKNGEDLEKGLVSIANWLCLGYVQTYLYYYLHSVRATVHDAQDPVSISNSKKLLGKGAPHSTRPHLCETISKDASLPFTGTGLNIDVDTYLQRQRKTQFSIMVHVIIFHKSNVN